MTKDMRLASLLSGGKDSVYSIQLVLDSGHEVSHAVTIFPERSDSYMFHVPNLWLTSLQAKSMGIKHVCRRSSGEKEKEILDLKDALRALDVDGVVVGAIRSDYQMTRISGVCEDLGLEVLAPLWGMCDEKLLYELLDRGYKIMIVGVYADGMGQDWLGKIIDPSTIQELKRLKASRGVGISFEGGEAETLVLDCPLFTSEIIVESAEVNWQVCRGEYEVKEASLAEKPRSSP